VIIRPLFVALGLSAIALTCADAAPTPVPGGANALVALAGKTGETVFNGVLRIKIIELRDATAADGTDGPSPSAGQKVMYMQALLHNGKHDTFTDLLTYTLADKDAVSVAIPSYLIKHANPSILQGAALKQSALFLVDKDFVPSKLIVDCASCSTTEHFRPVRFTVANQ
jgi:hypothetical protein